MMYRARLCNAADKYKDALLCLTEHFKQNITTTITDQEQEALEKGFSIMKMTIDL